MRIPNFAELLAGLAATVFFTAIFVFKTKRRGNFNPVHAALFAAFVAAWIYFVWGYL